VTEEPGRPFSFRAATTRDVAEVTALVDAAYSHYVDRLGMKPATSPTKPVLRAGTTR